MHNSQKIGHGADFRSKRRGKNVFINKIYHHHYHPDPNTVSQQIPTPTPLTMISTPLPPIARQIPLPPIPRQIPLPPIPVQTQLPPLPPHLRLPISALTSAQIPVTTQMNGSGGYGPIRGQGTTHYPVSYNHHQAPPLQRYHPYSSISSNAAKDASNVAIVGSSTTSIPSAQGTCMVGANVHVSDIFENYEVKRLRTENRRLQELVNKSEAERQRKKAAKKEKKQRKKARAKQRALDNDGSNSNGKSTKSTKAKPTKST